MMSLHEKASEYSTMVKPEPVRKKVEIRYCPV